MRPSYRIRHILRHFISTSQASRVSLSFRAPGRKVASGGLQSLVFKRFGLQAGKWPQEASRGPFSSISGSAAKWPQKASRAPFSSISGSRPQSGPRRLPEPRFQSFRAPGHKVGTGSFQSSVFKHFGLQAAKSPQEASKAIEYHVLYDIF